MKWWKDLEMKIKVIMSILALSSTLGLGTGVDAGMKVLERISNAESGIKVLADEQLKANYEFEKKRLNDNVRNLKQEIRQMKREDGCPECSGDDKEDFDDAKESLSEAKADLKGLEKKIESYNEEKLKELKK